MRIFTTGQVARIARVSCRTVSTWVDKGLILGAYRLPGSLDRRITEDGLRQFFVDNGMPSLEVLEASDAEDGE